ncbi:MAG: DUF1211 domain-containing protein [Methanomicrobium sp.]|nr:DUF1211 domain-containing protein [Methanomicrobium sp.]
MEAFSDGVLAIIITIMIPELKMPHGAGGFVSRFPDAGDAVFCGYVPCLRYVSSDVLSDCLRKLQCRGQRGECG